MLEKRKHFTVLSVIVSTGMFIVQPLPVSKQFNNKLIFLTWPSIPVNRLFSKPIVKLPVTEASQHLRIHTDCFPFCLSYCLSWGSQRDVVYLSWPIDFLSFPEVSPLYLGNSYRTTFKPLIIPPVIQAINLTTCYSRRSSYCQSYSLLLQPIHHIACLSKQFFQAMHSRPLFKLFIILPVTPAIHRTASHTLYCSSRFNIIPVYLNSLLKPLIILLLLNRSTCYSSHSSYCLFFLTVILATHHSIRYSRNSLHSSYCQFAKIVIQAIHHATVPVIAATLTFIIPLLWLNLFFN
jgi:hypothetical protein